MANSLDSKELLEREYEVLRLEVSNARDPDKYVDALGKLISKMQDEINTDQNLKGTNDLSRTFKEWVHIMEDYHTHKGAVKNLASDEVYEVSSNTLNNSGSPHMPFASEFDDQPTRIISRSMAQSVVAFIEARAKNLIPAKVEENILVRTNDYPQKSFCQVVTTLKGFKPKAGDLFVGDRVWKRTN